MNRVVGHLVMEGCVAKVADDCYCGGETIEEAISAYERLLIAFSANDLVLNPTKTTIFPKRCVILGWVWEMGTLSASSHRIAALSAVEPPTTVKALRSFIGAYKYISRVIRWHSDFVNPLDQIVAGKDSKEAIVWSDEMRGHFERCQKSLNSCKSIHIAKRTDKLWIHTDGALRPVTSLTGGIAATLFLVRDTKVLLGGFFNAPLKQAQRLWLPCEIEALAIGAAVSYFSPMIVQSVHRASVATDSRACVLAYDRMRRGLFSHSARVMTFLTAVCRYQVVITHKAGKEIPFTDYASRHPVQCTDNSCQVCKFVQDFAEQVVRRLSVQDVVTGAAHMPFTNRKSWIDSQRECPDLRKVFSFLSLGSRPRKKETTLRDVKTYLQQVVIANDGLLVVRNILPFQVESERIVVPKKFIRGLLTAIHLRFGHPTAHQLKQLVRRYFYAINIDRCIEEVSSACDTCDSLKFVPEELCVQSTTTSPTVVGSTFAFDVLKRERQLIAVLRETVTSYLTTSFIDSKSHSSLRYSLIIMSAGFKGFASKVRIDPAPGLNCLRNDPILNSHGITLDVGREKNRNKNPVAERAIQELEQEILKIQPDRGPVTSVTLALATAATNSRVRRDGLSSQELWTQRDQITGQQFPIDDQVIISNQSASRHDNHLPSAKSKHRPSRFCNPSNPIRVGGLVYLIADRSKLQARDKYLVTAIQKDHCTIRKFTRHQFRKQEYRVPLADVYTLSNDSSVPVPVVDSSSSDSDDDHVAGSDMLPVIEAEAGSEDVHDVDTVDDGDIGASVPDSEAVRQPRTRQKPDRYGDLVLSDDPRYGADSL